MIDGKETCWVGLKHQGFFKEFDAYEDYQNRKKKIFINTEEENKIKENIKKAEEIQLLKANYNPATDTLDEEEQKRKAHEKWKLEHLITEHDKEIYKGLNGGTLEEREIKEKDLTPEELEKQRLIDEDNADTKAKYDKYLGKNKQ